MSEIHGLIVDALPTRLHFGEDETPTPEKVQAMLSAMRAAGYSMQGMAIHDELSSMGVWFAQQWVQLVTQNTPDLSPLLQMFVRDMLPALGENWEHYSAPIDAITPHWSRGQQMCAQQPEYARKYMLDTAKSAADLLLRWVVLGRVAFQEATP